MSVVMGERMRFEMDLAIVESTRGSVWNADGTVNLVLIRPCNGRGVGARIYEAEMLRENAGVFAGWPMFDNHESPAAKRARDGLPRPVTDLGGVVRESWWDPSYRSAQDTALGFDRGAVIGRCALTEAMEALVRKVPEAVKVSLNCMATGLRPGSRRGKRGHVVEGIVDDSEASSVDLVTRAGAGGEVHAALMEAAREAAVRTTTGRTPMNMLEALRSPEVRQEIRDQVEQETALVAAELASEVREAAVLPRRPVEQRPGGRQPSREVQESVVASIAADRAALRRRLLDPMAGNAVSRDSDRAAASRDPELRPLLGLSAGELRGLRVAEAEEQQREASAAEDRRVREAAASVPMTESAREYRDSLVRQGLNPAQFGLPEAWS